MRSRTIFTLLIFWSVVGCQPKDTSVDPQPTQTCRLTSFTSTENGFNSTTLTKYTIDYNANGDVVATKRLITDPSSATLSTFSDQYELNKDGYVIGRTFSANYKFTDFFGYEYINYLDGFSTLKYDGSGRIIQIDVNERAGSSSGGSASVNHKNNYDYNDKGQLTNFTYLQTVTPSNSSLPVQSSRSETTFANGIITKYTEASPANSTPKEPYLLNERGLATAHLDNGKIDRKYAYDERGNMIRMESDNSQQTYIETYEYDNKPRSNVASNNAVNPDFVGLVNRGAKGHPKFVPVGSFFGSLKNNVIRETFTSLSNAGKTESVYNYEHIYNSDGFLTSSKKTKVGNTSILRQDSYEYRDCR